MTRTHLTVKPVLDLSDRVRSTAYERGRISRVELAGDLGLS